MKVTLMPTWELSTEHSASSYNQLVLVNRQSQEAFGPGDIVQPYPTWGYMTAADAVRRMVKVRKQSHKALVAAENFIGHMPEG